MMLLLITGAMLQLKTATARTGRSEHVVLVIIDGLRYTEGLGDPNHTFVPEMWRLAQQGAIVEPFLNDGFTYTSRAIPAIWCGAWTEILQFDDPDCGGLSNNYTELPTIFEYYRKEFSSPAEDCIYILKDVGCPWKASLDPDYGRDYWPLYHSVGSSDLDVWHEAKMILEAFTPTFSLIYLAEVDHAGHSGDWDYYTRSIAIADSVVGLIWEYVQTNAHYAGTTTMFVTNDHGRHTRDFSGHGDDCDGCRTIQLLAVGPNVKAGLVSTVPRTLRDITPTIGELLGFRTEKATGRAMTELFNETNVLAKRNREQRSELSLCAVPNPFNPATMLYFKIATPGEAHITIYDVSGKRVASLSRGFLNIGEHQWPWMALTPDGRPLPAGVYLIRLSTAGESTTQRVVLLK